MDVRGRWRRPLTAGVSALLRGSDLMLLMQRLDSGAPRGSLNDDNARRWE